MQSNFFLGFSTFSTLAVKNKVFAVWDHRQCIRIKIWSRIQVSMPQIEFSEAISDQIQRFSTFFARSFFRTFRVFGVHQFLQMWGLHGLPCTPQDAPWKVSMEERSFSPRSRIWDQNLPKNIFQVGPKAIFKLVRPTAIFQLEWPQAIFELDRQILKKFSNVLETIQEFP